MATSSQISSIDAAPARKHGALQQAREWLRNLFVSETIADRESLIAFLDRNAAFVAQKCATDYCRGKAGAMSQPLFKEKVFIDALTMCRWESYAAVLADMVLVAETHMFPTAKAMSAEKALKAALFDVFKATLTANAAPTHRPQGWDEIIEGFRPRQAAFDASAIVPPKQIGLAAARRMFETLPIHTNMRQFDEEIVFGAVQFHMVGFAQRLGEGLRHDAVVRDLLAATA